MQKLKRIFVVLMLCLFFPWVQGVFGDEPLKKSPTDKERHVAVEVVVKGGLSGGTARNVVKDHLDKLQSCYEEALKRNSRTKGNITLRFEVVSGGRLKGMRIVRCSVFKIIGYFLPRALRSI